MIPRAAAAILLSLFLTFPAFALDQSVIRKIERADDLEELSEEAEDLMKDYAQARPADLDEARLFSAELQNYLGYILIRQNHIIGGKLDKLNGEGD